MRRLLFAASVVVLVAGALAAGPLGRATSAIGAAQRGSFDRNPNCGPDRRTGRTVVKIFRDPGNDIPGHGDIDRVRISDARGFVTMALVVKTLRASDEIVVSFVDCSGLPSSEFTLEFGKTGGKSTLVHNDTEEGAVWVSRRGNTFSFRFTSGQFNHTTAFLFEAHVGTDEMGVLSDEAPDGTCCADAPWWYYDLTSR